MPSAGGLVRALRALRLVFHPIEAVQTGLLLARPRRSLTQLYHALARDAGLDRLYLVVSFNCDSADDTRVVEEVHQRMRSIGVVPVYAVPGEILQQSAETYRRIAADGAEFLNHGYRSHGGFFYDRQSFNTVREDVRAGDQAVRSIIGDNVRGFRTPHWGRFERPRQLRFLHEVIRRLGYRYSSSTSPRYGWRRGPVFTRFGLPEFPISGGITRPFQVIDSWTCFADPNRELGPQDYERELLGHAQSLSGGPGILNYCADPSHIADEPVFFSTMAALVRMAQPVSYARLVDLRR